MGTPGQQEAQQISLLQAGWLASRTSELSFSSAGSWQAVKGTPRRNQGELEEVWQVELKGMVIWGNVSALVFAISLRAMDI